GDGGDGGDTGCPGVVDCAGTCVANDLYVGDGWCDGDAAIYGENWCCLDLDGGDCTPEECAITNGG
ncbi:MAG: hypothetical protein VYD99_04675, partial [Planctomycetota bacterium]|nr:hypothetical protein [Planctomycetota bacterium]